MIKQVSHAWTSVKIEEEDDINIFGERTVGISTRRMKAEKSDLFKDPFIEAIIKPYRVRLGYIQRMK